MFTGIVEEVGRVCRLEFRDTGAALSITCSKVLQDTTPGCSIAVNGACLTAVEITAERFSADVSPETLKRTNLGLLTSGAPVNLERPLHANGRLEGHFVLGHVDGTGEIAAFNLLGNENWWLRVRLPEGLLPYVVSKGSLAVDGISLTVAEIDADVVSFTIVPHTYSHTTLYSYGPGCRVNLEADILAKHLERLLPVGVRNTQSPAG